MSFIAIRNLFIAPVLSLAKAIADYKPAGQ